MQTAVSLTHLPPWDGKGQAPTLLVPLDTSPHGLPGGDVRGNVLGLPEEGTGVSDGHTCFFLSCLWTRSWRTPSLGLRKLPRCEASGGEGDSRARLLDRNLQQPKQTCSPLTADPPIIPYLSNPKAHALLTSNTSEIKPRVTTRLTLKDPFTARQDSSQMPAKRRDNGAFSILRSSQ